MRQKLVSAKHDPILVLMSVSSEAHEGLYDEKAELIQKLLLVYGILRVCSVLLSIVGIHRQSFDGMLILER